MRSRFHQVDRDSKNNIVYIEDDFNLYGRRGYLYGGIKTVTNDAENVILWFRKIYGDKVRVVYRDTEMQWWEIVEKETWMGKGIGFEPWNGLAWSFLKN
jgi:hypothetical protein